MNDPTLHLMAQARVDNIAAIVGDRAGLEELQRAVNMALMTGSGGAFVFASDGEGYAIAVVLESQMQFVFTSYAGEAAPVRSLRELVPLQAVLNFQAALGKAQALAHDATASMQTGKQNE